MPAHFRVITQQHDDVIHLTGTKVLTRPPGLWVGVCYCVLSRGEMVRPVGKTRRRCILAIARAQYEMHLASQNVDASGRAEYAVLLKGAVRTRR